MRAMHRTLASLGLFTVIAGVSLAACSNTAEDCAKTNSCGGGVTTSSSSSSGGSSDACVPGPGTATVAAECGVFVSAVGSDTNDGSPEAPFQTFAAAIASAQGGMKRVYACAEEFTEALVVPGGIAVYGGLQCAEGKWNYVGDTTKTTVKPAADKVALSASGGDGTLHIADVKFIAADASSAGGSSIAGIVDGVTTELVRCDFEAGAGRSADDEAQESPVMPQDSGDATIKGVDGVAACTSGAADNAGGAAKTNDLCNTSMGGKGGTGMVDTGSNGEDGLPLPIPNPNSFGLGGIGASAASPCKSGEDGLFGTDGAPGAGAAGLGTLSSAGIAGLSGSDGTAGASGQGGGGGGGAKGKVGCAGASGGGGGAGGCGGNGGKGGKAGGSSVALVSINATLSFTNVALTAGVAGKGGDGADGQFGGIGGDGGLGGAQAPGTPKGCVGGIGGYGGAGGKGGGGRGGHSIGLAFMGAAPSMSGVTFTKGAEGQGGLGFDAAGNGQPGVLADTQEF